MTVFSINVVVFVERLGHYSVVNLDDVCKS